MSNSKISNLTAATTPLAGTEVLPINQSGVTVQVANNALRPLQIQSNATSGVLQVAGPAAASTRVMTTPDANFTAARTDAAQTFNGLQTLYANDWNFTNAANQTATVREVMDFMNPSASTTVSNGLQIGIRNNPAFANRGASVRMLQTGSSDAGGDASTFVSFWTYRNGYDNGKECWRVDQYGNFTQSVSGYGINFTANTPASGMTSQNLTWYEEGTWSLGLTTAGGNFSSISVQAQTCKYTRVGRIVTVIGAFYTSGTVSGGSGQVYITGLPFSSSVTAIGQTWTNPDTGNYASPSALPTGGITSGTQFRLFKNGSTNNSNFNSTDLATSGNANNIYFSVTYMV